MIVEGQIMGGLTEGFAIAAMELITFDEDGNCIGSNFMDYLIPTAWETPSFELGETVTPSPHHPIGAKGVGESATVGSPAAYVNAVVDALAHAGVRNFEMPVTSDKVWAALERGGLGGVNVLVEAGRLAAAGRPFALATVVACRAARLGAERRPCARHCRRRLARLGRRRMLGAGGRARGLRASEGSSRSRTATAPGR